MARYNTDSTTFESLEPCRCRKDDASHWLVEDIPQYWGIASCLAVVASAYDLVARHKTKDWGQNRVERIGHTALECAGPTSMCMKTNRARDKTERLVKVHNFRRIIAARKAFLFVYRNAIRPALARFANIIIHIPATPNTC